MKRRDATASRSAAALTVAAALLGATLAPVSPPLAACAGPVEAAAENGHTTAVRCDAPGRELRGPARRLYGLPLDPNRADAATLASLPGIGPARAAAILATRRERPFATLGDLQRVPGIGPRTLERLAPWVGVPGELEAGRRSVD